MQLLVVAPGHRADRVEGREDERLLLGLEVDVQDGDGRFAAAERERHPGMAVDDEAGAPVDEDLLDPADRVERAGERVLLRLRVDPPVRGVGQELVGRLLAGAGDPVAPGGGRGRRGGAGGHCVGSSRHVGQRGRARANLGGSPIRTRDNSRNPAACTQSGGATRSPGDCRRVLAPGGTLVLSSGDGRLSGIDRIVAAMVSSPFVNQRLVPFVAHANRADLKTINGLLVSGKVTPAIDRTYTLNETAAAVRYLGEGHMRGKVVVTV